MFAPVPVAGCVALALALAHVLTLRTPPTAFAVASEPRAPREQATHQLTAAPVPPTAIAAVRLTIYARDVTFLLRLPGCSNVA